MADPDRPLFADAKHQIARLASEFRRMAGLRWQLARLEFEAAVRLGKRLAIVWAIGAMMVSTALPLLLVSAAYLVPEAVRAYFLLILGLALLLGAILAGWWAWRRFRRQFVGLEETLEELREDLVWLQEWSGRSEEEEKRDER